MKENDRQRASQAAAAKAAYEASLVPLRPFTNQGITHFGRRQTIADAENLRQIEFQEQQRWAAHLATVQAELAQAEAARASREKQAADRAAMPKFGAQPYTPPEITFMDNFQYTKMDVGCEPTETQLLYGMICENPLRFGSDFYNYATILPSDIFKISNKLSEHLALAGVYINDDYFSPLEHALLDMDAVYQQRSQNPQKPFHFFSLRDELTNIHFIHRHPEDYRDFDKKPTIICSNRVRDVHQRLKDSLLLNGFSLLSGIIIKHPNWPIKRKHIPKSFGKWSCFVSIRQETYDSTFRKMYQVDNCLIYTVTIHYNDERRFFTDTNKKEQENEDPECFIIYFPIVNPPYTHSYQFLITTFFKSFAEYFNNHPPLSS